MPFPLNDLMFMNPVYCLPAALFTCVLLSATAASLHAETAYSTPCGYIQTDLNAKTTGYLGLGVHPEALMQHTLEENNITVSGSKITITDPDVNFTDLMETDSAYVLELIFGDEAMALPLNRDAWKKPAPSWTANKITVDDKSAADLIKNSKPVSYVLRKARTLNDVLGGDNTFSLKSGTSGTADAVYISTSPSIQIPVYHSATENKWMRRGSRDDMGLLPVFNHEPLKIVRKAGNGVQAFVIGEVAQKHQRLQLSQESTLLHTGLPVPQTLLSTSLHTALPDPSSDVVYVPLTPGGPLEPCYYDSSSGQWKNRDTGENVSSTAVEGILNILSGTLASGLEGKPIVLLINNDDSPGEFSMFTFRNVDTGELAKYPGVVGNDMTFFFGSQADAITEGYEWYAIPLFNDNFNLVPEPATATLSLLGLATLMMRRRR